MQRLISYTVEYFKRKDKTLCIAEKHGAEGKAILIGK
jgi:hypothetical protein